jgi:hypothetical protein
MMNGKVTNDDLQAVRQDYGRAIFEANQKVSK